MFAQRGGIASGQPANESRAENPRIGELVSPHQGSVRLVHREPRGAGRAATLDQAHPHKVRWARSTFSSLTR